MAYLASGPPWSLSKTGIVTKMLNIGKANIHMVATPFPFAWLMLGVAGRTASHSRPRIHTRLRSSGPTFGLGVPPPQHTGLSGPPGWPGVSAHPYAIARPPRRATAVPRGHAVRGRGAAPEARAGGQGVGGGGGRGGGRRVQRVVPGPPLAGAWAPPERESGDLTPKGGGGVQPPVLFSQPAAPRFSRRIR